MIKPRVWGFLLEFFIWYLGICILWIVLLEGTLEVLHLGGETYLGFHIGGGISRVSSCGVWITHGMSFVLGWTFIIKEIFCWIFFSLRVSQRYIGVSCALFILTKIFMYMFYIYATWLWCYMLEVKEDIYIREILE